MAQLKLGVDEFHFNKDGNYLDVKVINGESHITLKTTEEFSITTQKELDIIYNKLTELLSQSKKYKF